MVGPQSHPGVARLRSESNAGVDKPIAEPAAPTGWVDEQNAQLRGVVILTDTEHATDSDAVELGDPRGFPRAFVAVRIVGHDLRNQCLEGGVPAELGCVELTVGHHNPAQIAWEP